jgi:hypothetical protein
MQVDVLESAAHDATQQWLPLARPKRKSDKAWRTKLADLVPLCARNG